MRYTYVDLFLAKIAAVARRARSSVIRGDTPEIGTCEVTRAFW